MTDLRVGRDAAPAPILSEAATAETRVAQADPVAAPSAPDRAVRAEGEPDARAALAEGGARTKAGRLDRAAELYARIELDSTNIEITRRLDLDHDGEITPQEAETAASRAGVMRLMNEARSLSAGDAETLRSLTHANARPVRVIGAGGAQVNGVKAYEAEHERVIAAQQDRLAPLGTVAQERPGNTRNLDCGPAAGLYLQDRRIALATGEAPKRTHAEADALIEAATPRNGTNDHEVATMMDRKFAHAGGKYYRHEKVRITPESLKAELKKALALDPAGAIVPTIDTFNAGEREGSRHWLVVTELTKDDRVRFYDPAGSDGAKNEGEMSFAELRDALPDNTLTAPTRIIYGDPIPEKEATGELKAGRHLGQLSVAFGDPTIKVASHHGVFGSREVAELHAEKIAERFDADAVVRKENESWAVYGVEELSELEGSLWSSNRLENLDRDIVSAFSGAGTAQRRPEVGSAR